MPQHASVPWQQRNCKECHLHCQKWLHKCLKQFQVAPRVVSQIPNCVAKNNSSCNKSGISDTKLRCLKQFKLHQEWYLRYQIALQKTIQVATRVVSQIPNCVAKNNSSCNKSGISDTKLRCKKQFKLHQEWYLKYQIALQPSPVLVFSAAVSRNKGGHKTFPG